MDAVTAEKKRQVIAAYPGGDWANRVDKMSPQAIHTTYMRLLNAGKIKEKK